MSIWTAEELMCPQTSPRDGEHPQTLQQKGKGPQKILISLRIALHREQTTECGGVIKGEAPPSRGGVREVSQHTKSR